VAEAKGFIALLPVWHRAKGKLNKGVPRCHQNAGISRDVIENKHGRNSTCRISRDIYENKRLVLKYP
jgi:hypothetical protein